MRTSTSRAARRELARSRRVLRRMERDAARRDRASLARRTSAVLVAAVLGAGWWAGDRSGWETSGLGDLWSPRAYVEVGGDAVAVPQPEPADGRVLPKVPVTTTGSYAFLHVDEAGGPVGYDPCRPVAYVTNPSGRPSALDGVVHEAAQIVSEASGVSLVHQGDVDEPPMMDRPLIQPERYGEDWVPVLVAWSDEEAFPELEGQVAGIGGSAAVPGPTGEGRWLAAGRIVLDGPDLAAMLERPDGAGQVRAIVVHELAHVLGLDHVDDTGELMHPLTRDRTDLGPGDRQGLALLGQVACRP
ncbi:peptidase M10A and M12B matrixin and adamalysin [Actinotalea ferrariae CF5-4]|uniref:Peptidase M10A and M12B matrixin and adamalysin n=1 Tax=Actinotalea ferrariae CF5-4 TaxID=948458 RepID=A0A021VSQ7_9CELL|nr:matrixin family metalloprotease [Actinotalea ferrariae]EYR64191.1 peptidase M10A and M12B matrixin and adamalysin [Actinotalea ferrariae CF5-4]